MLTNKPLIVLGSARKDSDTGKFMNFIFSDIDYNLIDLLDFDISPYNYLEQYPDKDSFLTVIEEVLKHKTIVFATPVYWYAMSGILKTFFDRLTDLVSSQKQLGRKLKGKEIFLLAVGADEFLPQGFEIPFQSTSKYFHMAYKGAFYYSTTGLVSQNEVADQVRPFIIKLKHHEFFWCG